MKRKFFSALLSIVAIVGVAFASLPLTRPTIMTSTSELIVPCNVVFNIQVSFTNVNEFYVYRGGMFYGNIYEFYLPESVKNTPEMNYAEYSDRLFDGESRVEFWFVVHGINEGESDFDVTTCIAE